MKNVLVTGAAGLIGSNITKLLTKNDIHVICCDNFAIGNWRPEDKNITWVDLDLRSKDLDNQLSQFQFDALIHCAAHPGGKSLQEPTQNVEVNALGSMKLFEHCAHNKVPVIYLSSNMVYGNHNEPIKENFTLSPGTIYAVNKVACENYLHILNEGYGLEWTILRLFATYGAGHQPNTHQGIINVMLTQLNQGNHVIVKGSLERVRDLIYVEDVARAIYACLLNDKTRGHILNVGTGKPHTVGEMIKKLCLALDRSFDDVTLDVQPGTVGDPQYNVADISLLKKLTEFEPDYTLDAGLKALVHERLAIDQA